MQPLMNINNNDSFLFYCLKQNFTWNEWSAVVINHVGNRIYCFENILLVHSENFMRNIIYTEYNPAAFSICKSNYCFEEFCMIFCYLLFIFQSAGFTG